MTFYDTDKAETLLAPLQEAVLDGGRKVSVLKKRLADSEARLEMSKRELDKLEAKASDGIVGQKNSFDKFQRNITQKLSDIAGTEKLIEIISVDLLPGAVREEEASHKKLQSALLKLTEETRSVAEVKMAELFTSIVSRWDDFVAESLELHQSYGETVVLTAQCFPSCQHPRIDCLDPIGNGVSDATIPRGVGILAKDSKIVRDRQDWLEAQERRKGFEEENKKEKPPKKLPRTLLTGNLEPVGVDTPEGKQNLVEA